MPQTRHNEMVAKKQTKAMKIPKSEPLGVCFNSQECMSRNCPHGGERQMTLDFSMSTHKYIANPMCTKIIDL